MSAAGSELSNLIEPRLLLGFSEEALVEAAAAQMREMPFYVSAAARTLPVVAGLRLAG